METLVGLCKRRGFVFQSSDIYGGYNGFFDYGPLGAEVKKNIKDAWWHAMVHAREDIVGLDSSIIMHPEIWRASGHVDGFSDPMVDCRESKRRYRADQLFAAPVELDGQAAGLITLQEDAGEAEWVKRAKKLRDHQGKKDAKLNEARLGERREFTELTAGERALTLGPDAEAPGTLTEPRAFNLMFETKVGALAGDTATAYLRPETAQGIFVNYKNIVDTGRVKVPFGIAQIGKAFRNEITPRNFIFRSREFEQMEMEFFIEPGEENRLKWYRYWLDWCTGWLVSIGISREMIGEDVHPPEKLSHYSKGTTDLTFRFPQGVQELWGIACRGCFDLTQHQEHSGKSMEYFDEVTKQRYIPHVVEPALGVDRTFLAVLTAAYTEDEVPNEKGAPEQRTVLKFHPRIAPYKAAVFPLVKNKPELLEHARGLYERLRQRWNIFWDQSGAIGRRYRRQDEIGTPYGITVDFETLEKDGTVTLRDRDTTGQQRLSEDELVAFLADKCGG